MRPCEPGMVCTDQVTFTLLTVLAIWGGAMLWQKIETWWDDRKKYRR